MTVSYRTRNQTLLAKIEAVSGTEETPTVGANAVKGRFPILPDAKLESLDTDYVQSSLSETPPITGGGNIALPFACFLKGAGTAGTAPDYGVGLRMCTMSETLTAADVTGTSQAGGTTTTDVLAVGASAVDDFYKGMVIEMTGGAQSGYVGVITGYVGSTKTVAVTPAAAGAFDITSVYAIRASALYRPITNAPETGTLVHYQHNNDPAQNSRRSRLVGAAGSYTLNAKPRGLVDLAFNFIGKLVANPDDVAKPAAPTYQAQNPEPFINAKAYLGGTVVQFSEFTFDFGGAPQQYDDPAALYGYDVAAVTGRKPTGRITPIKTLLSSRDAFGDWTAGTARALWLRWGSAAGKRVSLLLPQIHYIGNDPIDDRGYAGEALPFRADLADGEIYICVH